MAHIQITPRKSGGYSVIVDGHDISTAVLTEGFAITPLEDVHPTKMAVTIRLRADRLEADLPDSIVLAETVEGD